MKRIFLIVFAIAGCWLAQINANQSFKPGDVWLDNNGVHVNAHGGGILYHDGKYYWFGEHKSEKSSSAFVGVTCYSSGDLYHWKYEGVALPVSQDENSPIVSGCVLERPKVIYNKKTGKFVMYFHLELKDKGYAAAQVGVAVADKAEGPYTFVQAGRVNAGHYPLNMTVEQRSGKAITGDFKDWWTPEWRKTVIDGMFTRRDLASGQMSRDMTLFVDEDGKAYHIYASEENLTLHLAELSDDYLSHTGKYIRIAPAGHNEAPAIFKKDGKYFMITSGCTGWEPNAARLFTADSLFGEWTEHPNPCVGNDANLTFHSQSTFILPVQGKKDAFIFMADRWTPKHPIDARYIWLPVLFENGLPVLKWLDEWDLNTFDTEYSQSDFRQWAQTPPMGWNSWDCYGPTVEEHEVKANADYMAKHLKKYGWEYIVVDIRWFVENDKAGGYNQTDPRYVLDEYGRYQPAVNRFPSAANNKGFQPLADYVHSKGLKFGIHIMRGVPKEAVAKKLPVHGTNGITANQIYSTANQCEWLRDNYTIVKGKPGAQEYYNSIMELYASWGVDFIKIDDLSAPIYHEDEVDMIRKAIDLTGRPIVLSTSPGETPVAAAHHVSTHANMWRMVNDVWDVWRDLPHLMNVAQDWYPYIAPGTWPDCDMIPLGRISIRGERGEDRMTRLTKEEQYSLMTFFTILRSPLMFGGDLPSNDKFTLSLLTNKEVLKMHRESSEVRQLFQTDDKLAITSRNIQTGEVYLAIFNLNDKENQIISIDFDELGISGSYNFTDLWSGKKAGNYENSFSQTLTPHASKLYKLMAIFVINTVVNYFGS
jgi:hypothetical protein